MTAEITPETLRLVLAVAEDYEATGAQFGDRYVVGGGAEIARRVAAIRSLIAHATEMCEWRQDKSGTWKTSCGERYDDGDDGHLMNYCGACGKRLTETKRPATTGEMMGEK